MTTKVRFAAVLAAVLLVPVLAPFGSSVSAASVGDVVTFSEVPLGTTVTTEYKAWGLRFGGDEPFVTTDGSNPTSPVLSGTPRFFGDLEVVVVDPATGVDSTSNGVQLDVGYINNRDSVEIVAFDPEGRRIATRRTNAFGINEVRIEGARIQRLTIRAVAREDAGFAIDNVKVLSEPMGITPDWVASLGDSYSSGEGLLPEDGLAYDCGTDLSKGTYVENTTASVFRFPGAANGVRVWPRGACDTLTGSPEEPGDFDTRPLRTHHNECHRHGRAYPNAVRERLGVTAERSLFVACSGAITENIGLLESGNWAKFFGNSPGRVAGGNLQHEDLAQFTADIGAASETGLITVGIGGNDAGFQSIIEACSWDQCVTKRGYTDDVLARLGTDVYPKLLRTFRELRSRHGGATIAAFGYPSVVSGAPDCPGLPGLFDQSERAWLADTFLPRLNDVIADAATTAGLSYIDITQATAGRELCTEEPVINGLRLGNNWPVASESFHPNQTGHDLITEFFIDNYTDGNGRLAFTNPEPQAAIDPPGGDISFRVGDVDVSPGAICGEDCLQPRVCDADCLLQIDGNGFAPGGTLQVTVYSEPQSLGEVTADETGRVSAELAVPSGLQPGFHHVELVGPLAGGGQQVGFAGFVVQPPRAAPTAAPQQLSVAVGDTLEVQLGGSVDDRLIAGYEVTGAPTRGSLSGDAPGLVYTPAPGPPGTDTIEFTVSDGVSTSDPATVTITVESAVPPPVEPPPPPPPTTPPGVGPATLIENPAGAGNVVAGISTPRAPQQSNLPVTGGSPRRLIGAAFVLLGGGLLLWAATRRRSAFGYG